VKVNFKQLVLWEDEYLLAVNKPAGLLSVPDGYDPSLPHLRGLVEPVYGRVWVVHRLDRDTSGVLIFARTAEAHRVLSQQFEERQIEKVYHALVAGDPPWHQKTVNLPLQPNGDRRHRTVVDRRKGKAATTKLSVLERFGVFSLLESSPQTGRTHQVRVHLAALGLPVVVDSLYGDGEGVYLSQVKPKYQKKASRVEKPLINRLGLHARSLRFQHPDKEEVVSIEAPYPKDFALVLKQLRKYSNFS
jgi:RluA family pseudouridine synthase